jgi:hypothetical protein
MEASYALTAFAVGIIISYLVAEFIGRQKHIGGWWSFFVVLSSLPLLFIPGLITTLASPSAKRKATDYAVWRIVLGVVVLILAIYLFAIYSTGYAHPKVKQTWLSWGICAMVIGAYLVTLGLGKVKNIRPKFRENLLGNWLSSKVEQAKKSVTLPEIKTRGKGDALYYIVEEGKPVGPLTLQQIKDKQPKAGTLACRNGESSWRKIEELNELVSYILYAPPPLPTDNNSSDLEPKNIDTNSFLYSNTEDDKKYSKFPNSRKTRLYIFAIAFLASMITLGIYSSENNAVVGESLQTEEAPWQEVVSEENFTVMTYQTGMKRGDTIYINGQPVKIKTLYTGFFGNRYAQFDTPLAIGPSDHPGRTVTEMRVDDINKGLKEGSVGMDWGAGFMGAGQSFVDIGSFNMPDVQMLGRGTPYTEVFFSTDPKTKKSGLGTLPEVGYQFSIGNKVYQVENPYMYDDKEPVVQVREISDPDQSISSYFSSTGGYKIIDSKDFNELYAPKNQVVNTKKEDAVTQGNKATVDEWISGIKNGKYSVSEVPRDLLPSLQAAGIDTSGASKPNPTTSTGNNKAPAPARAKTAPASSGPTDAQIRQALINADFPESEITQEMIDRERASGNLGRF